jgi:hypothetical protein
MRDSSFMLRFSSGAESCDRGISFYELRQLQAVELILEAITQ